MKIDKLIATTLPFIGWWFHPFLGIWLTIIGIGMLHVIYLIEIERLRG